MYSRSKLSCVISYAEDSTSALYFGRQEEEQNAEYRVKEAEV